MKPILRLTLVSVLVLSMSSCQKLIDKKKEQVAMGIITTGDWYVEQYFEGDDNVTSEFLNYVFHFNDDYTVTGIRQNESWSGTWKPDIVTITITAQFATAPAPLTRLNGIWKFKDSTKDFVKAEMTTATGKNMLSLRKKE
ncbi:hypothetical protein [Paraflavitalea sp. CAU 1676]|uniref:hypothetical protein n=1 Tax=Paraflavitalea sp. CAU 1676 TaxID=3032598 RepID=UPI0023DBA2FE|nr:hypothetical protein [Paraflavitalea sp. CAU 1676]MDF2187532.1 hypothetical protein [Paraflavitalea sp. CAU 1676]